MDLELAEQEGYADAFRAAPPALARQHGIAVATFDDVTCIRVADLPRSRVFNHVFGLGRSRPASDDDLDRVAEFYGDEIYFVALARDAEPGLAARLEARGFVPDYAWTRFRRGVEPPTPVESELRVQPIGPQHARDFGRVVAAGFELPAFTGRWLLALFARPRWTCFLAFARNEPAAAGTLFLSGGVGWLSFAATLPSSGSAARRALSSPPASEPQPSWAARWSSERQAPSRRAARRTRGHPSSSGGRWRRRGGDEARTLRSLTGVSKRPRDSWNSGSLITGR